MVRPAEALPELVVRAVSVPRLEAHALRHSFQRIVNLEAFESVPSPQDGLLVVIHANAGELDERLAGNVLARMPEQLQEESTWPEVGLCAVGLVTGYVYAGEHGSGTAEPGAYAPWLMEVDFLEPFKAVVVTPGELGIYRLPVSLEVKIARAWVESDAWAARP